MNDSELESLQCYPFHLPPVELGRKDKTAYRPLDGHDCAYLGSEEGLCRGPVEMYPRNARMPSGGVLYVLRCQGHINARLLDREAGVSSSYKPLDGHDCEFLGSEEGPCWGQVEDDFILFTGGMTINYYCRGHIKGRAWKYEEEETGEDAL